MAGVKGRSGRPRKPSAVKKANGTFRPSRAAKNEVSFPVSRLNPPDWLDDEAREEWERIIPLLDSVRILTDADLLALANYCSVAGLAIQATKAYQRDGIYPPLLRGAKIRRVHPMVAVAKEARMQALRYAVEFGLTPAARSRVHGQDPDNEKKDEAEEFLFHPPKLVINNK